MQVRLFLLSILTFGTHNVNAQEYEAHFIIKKKTASYELRNHTAIPIYIPVDPGFIRTSNDSIIFDTWDYSSYRHWTPNVFNPPKLKLLGPLTYGQINTQVHKKRGKRYFFRAFKMTYEEYMTKNGIKSPWMTTFNEFYKEYSFLIEGDCRFK